MATPRKSGDERMVSRTYRAAIRIGEDFITMEETIALPLDASDEEVTQAVDLGWRIFRAQREAADAQVHDIRSAIGTPAPITVRDPDAPASTPQQTRLAEPAAQSSNGGQASAGQSGAPVNEKQIHAMERLAQQQGLDLDKESQRRFDVDAHGLTYEQASSLLRELQPPASGRRAVNEPAL